MLSPFHVPSHTCSTHTSWLRDAHAPVESRRAGAPGVVARPGPPSAPPRDEEQRLWRFGGEFPGAEKLRDSPFDIPVQYHRNVKVPPIRGPLIISLSCAYLPGSDALTNALRWRLGGRRQRRPPGDPQLAELHEALHHRREPARGDALLGGGRLDGGSQSNGIQITFRVVHGISRSPELPLRGAWARRTHQRRSET